MTTPTTGGQLLSVQDAATFYKVSRQTIHAWIVSGKLVTVNIGPHRFVVAGSKR